MGYFAEKFLERRRQQWLRSIDTVEVQVDGKWIPGVMNKKEIDGNDLKILATFPALDETACTITASRLVDVNGSEAAYQQRKIQKNSGQGTMVQLTIPLYEVTL